MSLLVVVGLACATSPAVARQGATAPQQGDVVHQQGESAPAPHVPVDPRRELSRESGPTDSCDLDLLQESGGPGQTQAEQEAKRQALKWWQSPEGRAEFGITDQQSKDIEAVFQSLLPQLRANKTELDKQEKVLSQLLNEANSNEALVVQAIDRVEAARGALSRTRTLMLYRMYRLLSAEQRAKVQAYHERKSQESDNRTAQR